MLAPSIRTGPVVTAGSSMLCWTFTGIWIGGSLSASWSRIMRATSSIVEPLSTCSMPAAFSIPMWSTAIFARRGTRTARPRCRRAPRSR